MHLPNFPFNRNPVEFDANCRRPFRKYQTLSMTERLASNGGTAQVPLAWCSGSQGSSFQPPVLLLILPLYFFSLSFEATVVFTAQVPYRGMATSSSCFRPHHVYVLYTPPFLSRASDSTPSIALWLLLSTFYVSVYIFKLYSISLLAAGLVTIACPSTLTSFSASIPLFALGQHPFQHATPTI